MLNVESAALKAGAEIARKFTGDGSDLSPPLSWSKGPSGTKTFAITCTDPDAPVGTWWHWIIANIPAETLALGENVPKTAILAKDVCQGLNDFKQTGYNGPAPPPGKLHHYHFKVMALDCKLSLPKNFAKAAFQQAIKGHVLAEGELMGVYKR
ncbi:MAG: YbhB/YbcL family Raf kinase inhibitor-like protein [Candidatus Obscuribacterales bacterium]|nr:YbhB/YbcL family Raf kinase inhibitor-like protein [Candidatus Obscuribacterales bacterium]